MYNNTLQLNWKVGHGMPLTPVANNLDTSISTTGQTVENIGHIPALTNVMSSMNRQTHVTARKVNKKMSGKRQQGNNIAGAKNVRNNSLLSNNQSKVGNGEVTISKNVPSGKKNKNKSYTLRACSIQKRMETEHRTKLPRKRGPKPRPKTAPMSKYRRKTANLRERQRMGEINVAFEILREKIPSPITLKNGGKCEKLTKINILHIAINYIRAMENLLETGDSGVNSFKEMVKNPIRDDQDRKMEVQKVLEALMKRADNTSSGNSLVGALKRLPASRRNGPNRGKGGAGEGGGKRRNASKNSKLGNDRQDSIPDGVLRNRTENNENFDTAKAMSFLMSAIGSNYTDTESYIEKEDEKSSGTSDDEDEDDTGQSGLHFENMIMLPEWSELSSTLDISSLGSDKKMDTSVDSSSMPNLFLGETEKKSKEVLIQGDEYTNKVMSNDLQTLCVYGNSNSMSNGTCVNSNMIATTSSVNLVNSTILTAVDIKQPSNPLLLELMPIPQNNIKKQQELLSSQSQPVSTSFHNVLPVNRSQGVNQVTSSTNLSSSPAISMSPNSSNSSLSSNSSITSSSSAISSPISPSISLFKEPDPLFSSITLEKTPKFVSKQSEQMIPGTTLHHQLNQHVKLEARTTMESGLSYVTTLSSFQNEEHQNPPLISNSIKENNNHLLSGNMEVGGTVTGDDIMMRDFTDFVEMVDSLNGMPDIEFVEDNFEIFPS